MKKLSGLVVFLFLLIFSFKIASASEGTFELRSVDANKYKCFAASLQMQDLSYKVLISCRNIIFPVDDTIFTYILWANPKDGGNALKLGSIGLGRGEYTVKTAFTSLFITAEQNGAVKTPTGKVVMRGSIKPVSFLEKEVTTTNNDNETTKDEEEQVAEPTPTKTSVRDRLLTGIKRAGLASGLALIAILGLVFVLTRPK